MGRPPKERTEEPRVQVTKKVVKLSDYIPLVPQDEPEKIRVALAMMYSENKVVGQYEHKGETYLIAEV